MSHLAKPAHKGSLFGIVPPMLYLDHRPEVELLPQIPEGVDVKASHQIAAAEYCTASDGANQLLAAEGIWTELMWSCQHDSKSPKWEHHNTMTWLRFFWTMQAHDFRVL